MLARNSVGSGTCRHLPSSAPLILERFPRLQALHLSPWAPQPRTAKRTDHLYPTAERRKAGDSGRFPRTTSRLRGPTPTAAVPPGRGRACKSEKPQGEGASSGAAGRGPRERAGVARACGGDGRRRPSGRLGRQWPRHRRSRSAGQETWLQGLSKGFAPREGFGWARCRPNENMGLLLLAAEIFSMVSLLTWTS